MIGNCASIIQAQFILRRHPLHPNVVKFIPFSLTIYYKICVRWTLKKIHFCGFQSFRFRFCFYFQEKTIKTTSHWKNNCRKVVAASFVYYLEYLQLHAHEQFHKAEYCCRFIRRTKVIVESMWMRWIVDFCSWSIRWWDGAVLRDFYEYLRFKRGHV